MKKIIFAILLLVLVISFSGCQATPAPEEEAPAAQEEVVEEEAEEVAEEEAEPAPAEEVAEEEAEPAPTEEMAEEEVAEESMVGGDLVIAITSDPANLLSYKAANTTEEGIVSMMQATLVAQGPDGRYYPYLAKSWDISEDGTQYTFQLREDVKFHDGTPLTAADFEFAFNRLLESHPFAGWLLGPVTGVEAPDDYTFIINLSEANIALFNRLVLYYCAPVHQGHVDEFGEDALSRNPIGVGPYKFNEWRTADRVVLERNPDFTWGPEFWTSPGPFNIETVTFRIMPDAASTIAGVEAGEIDYSAVTPAELPLFENNDDFFLLSTLRQGVRPFIVMNVTKPPFDDVRIRQAMNMALNKEAIVQIVMQGNAVVQYGPIAESMTGYWPGVEEIGYKYDPEGAAALMQEAGYEKNADGVWEKDGVPMEMVWYARALSGDTSQYEVIQQQYKEFGINLEIQQYETGILLDEYLRPGNYELGVSSMSNNDCDFMVGIFSSGGIGGNNYIQLQDPVMDEILARTRTATNDEDRMQACMEAQKYATEQAFTIPVYTETSYSVVNARVQNVVLNPISQRVDWSGAYIVE